MARRRRSPSGGSDERRKRDLFLRRTAAALDLSKDEIIRRFQPSVDSTGRINRLRAESRQAVLTELTSAGVDATELAWYPDGFRFSTPKSEVAASPAVVDGRFFIQNMSSFLPPLALQPAPGEAILDACAAPGGKASHIAALTNGDVELWLNDGIRSRIPRLEDVERTLGFSAKSTTTHPAQYLDKYLTGPFDRILVDAQCSGEGLLDLRYPTALRYWSLARIHKYHHLQTKMLVAAFRLLRPGGTLVYSTCTVAPEENEAPVSSLLRREPSAAVEPLTFAEPATRPAVTRWEGQQYHSALRGALRLAPERGFEAFFVCRIRRLGADLALDDLRELDLIAEGHRQSGPA